MRVGADFRIMVRVVGGVVVVRVVGVVMAVVDTLCDVVVFLVMAFHGWRGDRSCIGSRLGLFFLVTGHSG